MKFIPNILALVALVAFTGCATKAVQSKKLIAENNIQPRSSLISDVKFIDHTEGYCGPSTLTMALQKAGHAVDVTETARQIYTPGLKGSLQTDLISAARRQGVMAVVIQGYPALMQELAAGNPVIIFENLGISWMPQWHYALVLGYDLDREDVVMHSGPTAFERRKMIDFELDWRLGEYWGLVVLPAGKLAASADERAQVSAAVGLEQVGKIKEAQISYEAIVDRWPTSLVGLMGLGNIAYAQGDRKQAIKWLEKAVQAHPESAAAKHNLAIAKSK